MAKKGGLRLGAATAVGAIAAGDHEIVCILLCSSTEAFTCPWFGHASDTNQMDPKELVPSICVSHPPLRNTRQLPLGVVFVIVRCLNRGIAWERD